MNNISNRRVSNVGLITFVNCSYLEIKDNNLGTNASNGNYGSGIFVVDSFNISVKDNTAYYNCDGMVLQSSKNITLINNAFMWNYYNGYGKLSGLHLRYNNEGNYIENNKFPGNGYGIYIESSDNDVIANTNLSFYGNSKCGIYLDHSSPHIHNNNFTGYQGIMIEGVYSNPIIEWNKFIGPAGGMAIYRLSYSNESAQILNNTIENYGLAGIYLLDSSSPQIMHNTIRNIIYDGITVYHGDSAPYIFNNTIYNTTNMGIQLEDSDAEIHNNIIHDVSEGINVNYNPNVAAFLGPLTGSNTKIENNTIWNCNRKPKQRPDGTTPTSRNAGIDFAGYSTGVIKNNNITNSSYSYNSAIQGYGILVLGAQWGARPSEISGNNVSYNRWGMVIIGSQDNLTVNNNTAIGNLFQGINFQGASSSVIVEHNTVSDNNKGIEAWNSDCQIKDNIITSNDYGIYVLAVEPGDSLPTIRNNNINWSTISGIYAINSSLVVQWNNFSNKEDRTGGFASYFYNCSDSTKIKNNTYLNSFRAIYLQYTPAVVRDNSISLVVGDVSKDDSVGIAVYHSSNATVINNIITKGDSGIKVEYNSYATVIANRVDNASYNGIFIRDASPFISQNVLESNRNGTRILQDSSPLITNNWINWSGLYGIYVNESSPQVEWNTFRNLENRTGGISSYIYNCGSIVKITNNTYINSHRAIYLMYSYALVQDNNISLITGNTSQDDTCGIAVYHQTEATVINNTIINGDSGIRVEYGACGTILSNNITNCSYYGIFTRNLYSSELSNNELINNNVGIRLNYTYYVIIKYNFISTSISYGFYVYYSDDNLIYHNNIINNSIQAYDNGLTAQWDNGYPLGGNYWSDYSGYDNFSGPGQNLSGSDGIGDTPYIIDADSNDSYPLMKPIVGNRMWRAPFRINSNSDFDAAHGVSSGNGTQSNPWIIENYYINGSDYGYCIYIGNTTDYFIVRGCKLYNASGGDSGYYFGNIGLILYNVQNGTVTDNNISSNILNGIYLRSSSSNSIINNNLISDNDKGILIVNSDHNYISNNKISNNTYGINVTQSSKNTIENNTISYNDFGINLSSSQQTNITWNDIINNSYYGIYSIDSDYTEIEDNNVYNSSNYYFSSGVYIGVGSDNTKIVKNKILNNSQGIIIDQSSNVVIENNSILYNSWGMIITFSSLIIQYNNISNNVIGIGDALYSNAIISNNIITYNQGFGIGDRTYCNTTIDNNTISFNDCGIGSQEYCFSLITYNNITFNNVGIRSEIGSNLTVHWNNIYNNIECGLDNNDTTIVINATNNYWGTGKNPPQEGVDYDGFVEYDPWEYEPIEDAGPQ